jgi:hypothetical protein
LSSQACCFCRKLAGADEIDRNLFICPRCAGRATVSCSSYASASAGKIVLWRDDGRSVVVTTFANWTVNGSLLSVLAGKRATLEGYLRKIAQGH